MMGRKIAMSAASIVLGACGFKGIEPTTDPWTPPTQAAQGAALKPRADCNNAVSERQALFGDLHIHTSLSMDANALGTSTLPEDAYRFARGQVIDVYSGDPKRGSRPDQIDRPLDFAAVTDHAEWMAEVSLCTTPGSPTYDSKGCQIYRGEEESFFAKLLGLKGFRAKLGGVLGVTGRRSDVCGDDDKICRAELGKVWQSTQEAAERWYDRSANCEFTTFHAWEYSHSPYSTKVHRNIILRNEISPELPISSLETPVEMNLRHQLVDLCNDTDSGCEAIAIPHNPNLSNGQMFRVEYADLPPEQQRQEAALRARLEPIVEMMQIKGESECRNGMFEVLGAPDELCNFEKIRDLGAQDMPDCEAGAGWGAQAGKGCTSRTDYVRYALLEGLREKQRVGVNPYSFGFIGSTDNHMATPGAVSEYGVPHKFGATRTSLVTSDNRKRAPAFWNPGGLAGVWAEENTRDSIFDALKRRESFATSGPRIKPRLFAGWNMPKELCNDPEFVQTGYATGVPMGGVLTQKPAGGAVPTIAVSALADPGAPEQPGGLLQRIQIIKGWVDEQGKFNQEVHDIAGDADNGAGVDTETCTATGPGAAALCGVWRDPHFDAATDAVYYARVIENPSCRWSTRLCLSMPEDERPGGCLTDQLPKTIQERAWTSPVWYVGTE
ncbi:MAG: DUF3604 domain-containing protein [Halieaceae bacterium]|jgi:hypothetical protein|nr:DUF3604 domain-containing protein [Halieaceae bacterium]